MGVIRQGILGGFSGSVGAVTGSSWKGIAVMKSKPLSVANPNTAAQITNRTKFAFCVAFAKTCLVDTVKPLMDRSAVKMSGYNRFVSLNQQHFDVDGLNTPASVVISTGNVRAGSDLAGSVQRVANTVTFVWTDNTGDGNALATDVAHGCVYNITRNESVPIAATATRATEIKTAVMPATWADVDVYAFYLAFRRADGSATSDTSYDALN